MCARAVSEMAPSTTTIVRPSMVWGTDATSVSWASGGLEAILWAIAEAGSSPKTAA